MIQLRRGELIGLLALIRRTGFVLFAGLGWLIVATGVSEAAILNFDLPVLQPPSASVSYAGGATPLIGHGILVDEVTGLDVPLHNLVTRQVIGGVLDFQTGNFTGPNLLPPGWLFATGGTITIKGGVDLDGDHVIGAGDIPLGTTLLSGTFAGTAFVDDFVNPFKVVGAGLSDVKQADLASFYGVSGGEALWDGGLNLRFVASGAHPSGRFSSSTVLSGDVANEPEMPEPASLVLFGLGGLGAAISRRRKWFTVVS